MTSPEPADSNNSSYIPVLTGSPLSRLINNLVCFKVWLILWFMLTTRLICRLWAFVFYLTLSKPFLFIIHHYKCIFAAHESWAFLLLFVSLSGLTIICLFYCCQNKVFCTSPVNIGIDWLLSHVLLINRLLAADRSYFWISIETLLPHTVVP